MTKAPETGLFLSDTSQVSGGRRGVVHGRGRGRRGRRGARVLRVVGGELRGRSIDLGLDGVDGGLIGAAGLGERHEVGNGLGVDGGLRGQGIDGCGQLGEIGHDLILCVVNDGVELSEQSTFSRFHECVESLKKLEFRHGVTALA